MIDRKNLTTIKKERREKKLRVPVLPIEEAEIKNKATDAGMTVAEYLRNLGMGYQVPSIVDSRQVDSLLKINGDLGRLGGLLKLWLTNDKRTKLIGKPELHMPLDSIRNTQNTMLDVIIKLKK
ncbi:MAG: conjugal transfer transcriptional regulator TraJ [Nitrosomonas sp.]|nr:conjugal transfer transcriptional regulator TraJ [Nitrosomonas sp.]